MKAKHCLLAVSIVFASLFSAAHAQSNAILQKAEEDAKAVVMKGPPPGPRVLEPANYFLEKFRKEYLTTDAQGQPAMFTLSKGPKFLICLEVAKAMREAAETIESTDTLTTVQTKWAMRQRQLPSQLSSVAKASDVEKDIWKQFLKEWEDDVSQSDAVQSDPSKFKDALLQAAYEITKAALDIQTAQEAEAEAKKPEGSPGGAASAGVGRQTRSNIVRHADVIHARLMNGIYRRHDRWMNRIERINARR